MAEKGLRPVVNRENWNVQKSGAVQRNIDLQHLAGKPFDASLDMRPILASVLAAFAAMLHRYSGHDAITLESQIAFGNAPDVCAEDGGRPWMRLTLRQATTFENLVEQAHQELQRILPNPSADRFKAVFSVSVEVHNELATAPLPDATPHERLRLLAFQSGAELEFALEHGPGAFEEWMSFQMATHVTRFIAAALVGSTVCVAEVPLLDIHESTMILDQWNSTDRPCSEVAIPELFAAQVSRTPDRIALAYGDERITFWELNGRANRLGFYLRRQGVAPGSLVGFCYQNSIQAVIALLAILKAGGAYVPLDPSYPVARVEEIMANAGLSMIVTETAFRDRVPAGDLLIVDIQAQSERIDAEPCTNFDSGCTPDSAAYVVYTSGSTGKPKGVVGIHRSVVNALHETLFDSARTDEVCCLNGSLSVAFVILGIFLPLLSGVPLVILSAEQYRDPLLLADIVDSEKITSLVLPTPALRQLVSLGQRATSRLHSLRTVMVGGAAVTADLVDAFTRILPHARLNKGYGSSEIGGIATKGRAMQGKSVGRPIANTRIYILDKYRNPVPVGVTGEIYVGARHLALEYLNQPELTAASFLVNPFTKTAGERLYRTGDLGRFRPDGELEFLGRVDDQVKIRGFRVEPGEIEGVLHHHEGVQDATVAVRELGGQAQLVAYVIASGSTPPALRQLREYIQQRLPNYMVPSTFVFVDHFPMTLSGKIDRKALPLPDASRPLLETAYVAPRNSVESAVAKIWADLLNIREVGIHDHFVDLGGDSFFGVLVTSRIWDELEFKYPLELMMLQHPTVAEMAAHIVAGTTGGGSGQG